MSSDPHDSKPDEVTSDFIGDEGSSGTPTPPANDETVEYSLEKHAADEKARSQESGSDQDISGPALPRFGRYVLLEKLGQGGMGEVYRALHTRLHKQVALKLLPKSRATSRPARERFQREIQLISRLSHPHVVRLENAGEEDGQLFLIMEYVPGVNLKQMLTRIGPLRPADACQIAGQAALGLSHLHEQRLVHRDLKPSNLIFCTADGSVKIADLGVARLAEGSSEITASGRIVGDPHYMAPEQIEGKPLDIRADIYSLGCTLYTLLTGKPPFVEVAGDIPEVLKGHLNRRFPQLAHRCKDVPSGLQRVMDQLTAREPADRPTLPLDVAAALAPFASGCDLQALAKRLDPAADDLSSGSLTGIHSAEYLSVKSASADRPRRSRVGMIPVAFGVVAVAVLAFVLWWIGVIR